jgi:hypothetical protein
MELKGYCLGRAAGRNGRQQELRTPRSPAPDPWRDRPHQAALLKYE